MLTKAISLGYIHISNLKKTDTMDLIPIDMTVNSLLAMIWDFVVYRYFLLYTHYYSLLLKKKKRKSYTNKIIIFFSLFLGKKKNQKYIIMDLLIGIP